MAHMAIGDDVADDRAIQAQSRCGKLGAELVEGDRLACGN